MEPVASGLSQLFTQLTTFISGLFGGIGDIITGINAEPVLMAFAFLIPLTSVGISYLFRFMGRRSRRRR